MRNEIVVITYGSMVNYRFNEALREIDPTSINWHCQFHQSRAREQ